MPIYDYVCRACGHILEVIHPVDAAGPSECPVCGGEMRRAMSAPTIHFKGSGWAKKERSAAASPASKSAESGGDAAKPAADAAKPAPGDSSSTATSSTTEAS